MQLEDILLIKLFDWTQWKISEFYRKNMKVKGQRSKCLWYSYSGLHRISIVLQGNNAYVNLFIKINSAKTIFFFWSFWPLMWVGLQLVAGRLLDVPNLQVRFNQHIWMRQKRPFKPTTYVNALAFSSLNQT